MGAEVVKGDVMRARVRAAIVVVTVAHGLVHLLGSRLTAGAAAAWLAAAVLLAAAGVLLALRSRWWWMVGAVAVTVSQALILTSWTDARAGTAANVVVLVAVLYGFASQGPISPRAEYRRRASEAVAEVVPDGRVTEADLEHLPAPVAAYVRQSGAVGQPRVGYFHARIHGRIRARADKPWMTFTGEQVNTYGREPSRLFFLDATMKGLPVDVIHTFVGPSATMRAKVCSLVTMVDASGPDMDRAETVTLFNDLCILAPAALVDAPVDWEVIDDRHVRGSFTNFDHRVTAELVFNDDHELVDFVSDDRLRASGDGKSFTPQRWSTPVLSYSNIGCRRLATVGKAQWHAPAPEWTFTYLEFFVDEISFGAGSRAGVLGRS